MRRIKNVFTMFLLTCAMILFSSINVPQAAEFHVNTAVEFQNALTAARDNGEADTIWLSSGTYNASDNNYAFTYIAKDGEDYDLTIKGEAGTTAEDIILDGNGEYEVLSIEQGSAPVTIEGITVKNGVGGISISSSGDIVLTNNIITENTSWGLSFHGGVCVVSSLGSNIILSNNIITENTSLSGGGVRVYSWSSCDITIINNIITGNTALDGGGIYVGSYCSSVITTLTNNTITKNKASLNGGGLYLECHEEDIIANIYNNIIWGNEGEEGNDIYYEGHIYAIAYVYNNNFHDKAGSPFTEDIDNIDVDPMFVNPELGDYHLRFGSPCINKGTADAPELPSTDFEGDSRIIGKAPDIGADEFNPYPFPTTTTIPVTTTTTTTIPSNTTTTMVSTTTTTTILTTTTTTIPSICAIEEIYGGYAEETELLRYFRDNVLSETPEGQEIIELYYQWSPMIVKTMEKDEEFKEEVKTIIDRILLLIRTKVE